MAANGPAPDAPLTLYPGEVMHARLKPFGHRFVYRVFSILVDLDRLEEAGRLSPLFSVNAGGIASFHEADHVEPGDAGCRAFADRLLSQAGLAEPAHRILLLAYPRIAGYVFNPLSVYFAYGRSGALIAVIYSVRNTFGERHHYVARVEPGELSDGGLRQGRNKLFHVSPFIGMDARYEFRILPPGEVVRVRIHETEHGEPLLAATFSGSARPATTSQLARCLLRYPLMTWKIIAGIHLEALKLWWKGARFRRSPPAPERVSYDDRRVLPEPGE